jgi:endonuclease G
VLNDQWEVVALHHSGVPRRDAEGRLLRRDGKVWQDGDGDDAVDWVANEGARVSVVLTHLAGRQDVAAPERALLAGMGPDSGLAAAGDTDSPVAESPGAAVPTPLGVAAESTSPPGPQGLTGRAAAFGGAHALVLVHGRGQHGKDPVLLRRSWAGGLNRGLTLAGLPPVDPADAWFPFYGDALAAALDAHESLAAAPAPSELALYADLVGEAAERAGMPAAALVVPADDDGGGAHRAVPGLRPDESLAGIGAALVGRLHPQLSWLAARSGLDTEAIAALFRDVAAYLERPPVRRAVLDAVRATLPQEGHLVLVTHSLGTVVGIDLLHEPPPGVTVDLLVTAGSPLGLDTVQSRLLAGRARRPDVGRWLNVWSAADPVAIGCPLADDWRGQLDELVVEHDKEHAHDITRYLAHSAVAGAIGTALS